MSEPLFGCQNEDCASEVSYLADMLRLYEGKPICEQCYEYTVTVEGDWYGLAPFVPDHEIEIERLKALLSTLGVTDEEMNSGHPPEAAKTGKQKPS